MKQCYVESWQFTSGQWPVEFAVFKLHLHLNCDCNSTETGNQTGNRQLANCQLSV